MRVSVILPVRNGGGYLVGAVESILSQTFRDFELLAIDDGSTDGAVDALHAAARDARLRRIDSGGKGLAHALNLGLKASRADLVARMDADDLALPERLARQVAFLDAHPEIAVLGAQAAFIDANGALTGEQTHFPTAARDVAAALLSRGCVVKHPTVLARKSAILAAGGYRSAFVPAEDFDLWLRVAECAGVANLPDVLLRYRIHAAQTSSGVNLRQRFAHDLALIAARARRKGGPDPFEGIDDPLSFAAQSAGSLPAAAVGLAKAYAGLAFFEGEIAEAPDTDSLEQILAGAHAELLGDGRRYRALALVRVARLAAKRRAWPLAAKAAALALRQAPGRALPLLLGGAIGAAQPER